MTLNLRNLALFLTLMIGCGSVYSARLDHLNLPTMGATGSSVLSDNKLHTLGRTWLKAFRAQAPTLEDPLLQDYLENLLYKLAVNSELEDRRLELVVVDNPTINAFAVPGGVVGVHSGLFLFAEGEAELASVLAHEIAHLSQNHFSRSVEAQRANQIPTMAGILAGVILAATTGSDAGLAAISATQAAAIDSRLRFSRGFEREADRIGMDTLVNSDMDPNAMPAMFTTMNQRFRYQESRPPEFLLTHPLTETRISDSRNRARQYQRRVYTENLDFQLMKMRVRVNQSKDKALFLSQLRNLEDHDRGEAQRYGQVLALTALGQYQKAELQLDTLISRKPDKVPYILAAADLALAQQKFQQATAILDRGLAVNIDNYPLLMKRAEVLQQAGDAKRGQETLEKLARARPEDPQVWYHLAEVRGLANDILGVHKARAEYFILSGRFDSAEKQLRYARTLAKDQYVEERRVIQKLKELQQLKAEIEAL